MQLLRVKLNIPCILGLTAAATESNVQALIKQLDFEFTSLEDRLPIPQGKVKLDVLLNASLDDKNKVRHCKVYTGLCDRFCLQPPAGFLCYQYRLDAEVEVSQENRYSE